MAFDALGKLFDKPGVTPAVIGGGFDLLSSLFANKAQTARTEQERQQAIYEQIANTYGQQAADHYNRSLQGLQSTQQNPVTQQEDLFRAAALRRLAGQGAARLNPATGQVENQASFGPEASQFLGDPQLMAGMANFAAHQGSVDPYGPQIDLAKRGFAQTPGVADAQAAVGDQFTQSRTQFEDDRARQRQALMAAMNIPQQQGSASQSGKPSKKSLWSKILGIGAMVAAPFTGGLTALIPAALGATSAGLALGDHDPMGTISGAMSAYGGLSRLGKPQGITRYPSTITDVPPGYPPNPTLPPWLQPPNPYRGERT